MSVTITNGTLTASINPKGAELFSLKKGEQEFMWEGNPDFWGKHSPVLFPIVGTLKDNTYNYNGALYNLSRHGFARDNVFELVSNEGNRAVFSLKASDTTKQVYPFDFELQLIYTLTNETLKLEYNIINQDNTSIPFSIGAHPAFALPGDFEAYSLKFKKDEQLISTALEKDLLSEQKTTIENENGIVPLNYALFENDALIFTSLESKSITIQKAGQNYIEVTFPDFPHLGIWTKVGAPFLCIEPWQGYSDPWNADGDITKKPGIINLEPKTIYKSAFTVKVF